MADMVTRQELEAAKVDVKHAGEAVNAKKVITPRYGNAFKSIPLLSEELQQILNNKDLEGSQKLQALQDVIEIALAAGAGEAGWTASLVADASGKNQQEINNNVAYFYRTVTQMVADKKLIDGKIVATKGYHNISDDGGSIYLISSAATDYSIPLENGLHAIFRDTFDIRKFGIISSATIDQTANLKRMIAYADSRVYRIDFHNYEIMTPNIVNYTSSRGTTFKGMGFNFVHEIANIRPCNNKSVVLQGGTIPIQFLPKRKGDGDETFKLTNVSFDLYVSNFNQTSAEGDGRFHGFYAGWHPDYPVAAPTNLQSESGYKFKTDGVYSKTPAITSTMALNIWFNSIDFGKMGGEYIGYFTTHFGTRVDANICDFTFRDDLYAVVGRGMVSNAFQEEQEVGSEDFAYNQEYQRFKNISCKNFSNNSPHSAIKRMVKGVPTLKEWTCENIVGEVATNVIAPSLTVEKFTLKNVLNVGRLGCKVLDFSVESSPMVNLLAVDSLNKTAKFHLIKCDINNVLFYDGADIDKITFTDCNFNSAIAIRSQVKIKEVVIDGGEANVTRLLLVDFQKVSIKLLEIKGSSGSTATDSFVYKLGANWTHATVDISYTGSTITPTLLVALDAANIATQYISANLLFNNFPSLPTFRLGNTGILKYQNNQPSQTWGKTFDPPVIPANSYLITDVVSSVVVGDAVAATITQYNENIEIFPLVSAANTVTVKFKNTSDTAVDLPSGVLTVKKI